MIKKLLICTPKPQSKVLREAQYNLGVMYYNGQGLYTKL